MTNSGTVSNLGKSFAKATALVSSNIVGTGASIQMRDAWDG
ncbi:MAG: hypothetical protein RL341_1572 [Pseudomonadota bacterium]